MKIIGLIRRYAGLYSSQIIFSALFHLLTALLTVVSIPIVIPIFQLLFDRSAQDPYASTSLPSFLVNPILSIINRYEASTALIIFCFVMVVIFFFKNLFRYLAMYFMTPVRNGVLYQLRSRIYDHILHQNISFFKDEPTGKLLSYFSNDVQEIEWSILKTVETFFKAPLVILVSFLFMFLINVKLTLLVFVLAIIVVFLIGGLSRKLKSDSHIGQSLLAEMLSMIEENILSQKLIKTFDLKSWRKTKFEEINIENYKVNNRMLWRRDASSPLSEFFGVALVIFLMWYASGLVFQDELAPETFFAFIFAFYNVIEPSKAFSTAFFHAKKGQAAAERLEAFFNHKNTIAKPTSTKSLKKIESSVEFRNVSFKYPERAVESISNFNLKIAAGEIIGITGASGSGKTTIIDLLFGFYKIDKGEILIGKYSIDHLVEQEISSLFSLVSQHTSLFHGSIAQNISLSDHIDETAIKLAAEKAGIIDFINELPDTLNTIVGERGMKLSGGQRQRIAIARAIYKDAPILILDEATSSVDAESEEKIIDACTDYFKDKTVIIISHRGRILDLAEKIYHLNNGKLLMHR